MGCLNYEIGYSDRRGPCNSRRQYSDLPTRLCGTDDALYRLSARGRTVPQSDDLLWAGLWRVSLSPQRAGNQLSLYYLAGRAAHSPTLQGEKGRVRSHALQRDHSLNPQRGTDQT